MTNLLTQPSQSPATTFHSPTDDRLAVDATSLFEHSAYAALRGVKCECREGVVTLQGRIPSFFLKQVALKMARDLAGVQAVINRLEVSYDKP